MPQVTIKHFFLDNPAWPPKPPPEPSPPTESWHVQGLAKLSLLQQTIIPYGFFVVLGIGGGRDGRI